MTTKIRKRIPCTKCPSYSRKLRRCSNGKVNPPTRKGVKEAMTVMGVGYICSLSPWKIVVAEEILEEAMRKK